MSLEHLKSYAELRSMSLLEASGEVQKVPAIKGKAAIGLRDFHRLMINLQSVLEQPPDEVVRASDRAKRLWSDIAEIV